jgi:flagellar biosynthetic protein FliR
MTLLESLLISHFTVFVLVLGRIGAVIMTAPVFSSPAAPVRVRVVLAVGLALVVTPLHLGGVATQPTDLMHLARLMASEVLLGLLLGLGVAVLLSGVQLTGQIVSQLGGTAVAETFDPSIDSTSSVFSQLFYFLALVMFLLLDGHRMVIEGLLDTYLWLPPGRAAVGRSYVEVVTTLLSQSFSLGIRAAAPAMVALLCATLLLGLIGRTLPQINILAVGFGVNAFLSLGILFVSLGTIAWAFPQQCTAAVGLILEAIQTSLTDVSP